MRTLCTESSSEGSGIEFNVIGRSMELLSASWKKKYICRSIDIYIYIHREREREPLQTKLHHIPHIDMSLETCHGMAASGHGMSTQKTTAGSIGCLALPDFVCINTYIYIYILFQNKPWLLLVFSVFLLKSLFLQLFICHQAKISPVRF